MSAAQNWGCRIASFLDKFGIKDRPRWEFALMRIAFAAVVFFNFHPAKDRFETRGNLVGIAKTFDYDLTFLADPATYQSLERTAVVALVIYAIGILPVLPLGYLAWFSIVGGTLFNSRGISHSYQIISLILLVQFIVAACALLVPLFKQRRFHLFQTRFWDSCALYYTQLGIAGTYVIAAVTKLNNSGLAWFWNSPYLAMDLVKTERQYYYASLKDHLYGGFGKEVDYVNFITENPNLARILFSPGILLELAAVLALLGRRWALAVGLALIALHVGIKEVMHLDFIKNEICLTIFYINLPFWIYYLAQRARGRKIELL